MAGRRVKIAVDGDTSGFRREIVAAAASVKGFLLELNAVNGKTFGKQDIAASAATAGKAGAESFVSSFAGSLKTGLSSTFQQVSSLGLGGANLSGLFAVTGAATAAVAIKKIADSTAQYAGEVRQLKGITGASAEDASKLDAQLHVLGVDVDKTTRPFLTLSKSLQSGGGALRGFFSEEEIATLRAGNLAQATDLIANRFQAIHDPIERNSLAVAAFGTRGAVALRPLLLASKELRDQISDDAAAQGLVFTDSQLDSARRYQITTRELAQTFKGLEVEIGQEVIPVLTAFLQDVDHAILKVHSMGDSLDKNFGDGSKWLNFRAAFRDIGGFWHEIWSLPDTIATSIDGVDRSASNAADSSGSLGDAIDAANQSADDLQQSMQEAATAEDAARKSAEAFARALDPLKDFKLPDAKEAAQNFADANDKVTASTDRLTESKGRVTDLQTKIRENESYLIRTPERDAQLAKDRRDLDKATHDVTKAEGELKKARQESADAQLKLTPSQALEKQYKDEIAKKQRFVKELGDAAKHGADPAFLQKALADPDKYLPILDALEKDSSGKLLGIINDSEQKIRDLGNRLSIISATVDEGVKEQLSALKGDLLDALTEALTAPTDEVFQLAVSIGERITQGVISGMTKNGAAPPGSTTGYTGGDLSAVSDDGSNKKAANEQKFDKYYRSPGDPGYGTESPPFKSSDTERAWEQYKKDGGREDPSYWYHNGPLDMNGVKGYAEGGIEAHVATQPTLLFGERSTGGEAFIPLGPGHRGRSTMLLSEVSQMFGYGLVPLSGAGLGLPQWSTPRSTSHSVQHRYFEGANITGPSMSDIERYADRKRTQTELMGAM